MKTPEYKERIDAWVDAHQDQILEDLKKLVMIPSVRGVPEEGMPYGRMPAQAVQAMQELMQQYGFGTVNYENHCVAGDLEGTGTKALDILTHLDVVPVSDDWTKTAPFEPLIEGDRIYGRGTSDDKGPAVAALYAMRCIKELGLPLARGVRLICGSDEECGSGDLKYYYSREEEALYSISPDARYPLIHIEKGRLQGEFSACGTDEAKAGKPRNVRVVRIEAGDTPNIVPGKGTVILSGVNEAQLKEAVSGTGAAEGTFSFEADEDHEDQFLVRVKTQSAHAASPQDGVNAVTLILEFLKHLDLAGLGGEKMLLQAGKLWPHGDHHGRALGVDYKDEESGGLTMSLDILRYETSPDQASWSLSGCFDCRAPICCNDSNLTAKVRERLHEAGLEMKDQPMVPAHYVSADSELVVKLLESYELYFGKKGKPVAIGGGTYVHELKRGVAFGCAIPEVDNRMHGDDEFMEIPMLMKSTKILADVILRLCG
jgi:succinyl-diaminopimelate desuccinylase